MRRFSIGTKITLVLTAVALITVFTLSFIAYNFSLDRLKKEKLDALAVKTKVADTHFDGLINTLRSVAKLAVRTPELSDLLADEQDSLSNPEAVVETLTGHDLVNAVIIATSNGQVLYASNSNAYPQGLNFSSVAEENVSGVTTEGVISPLVYHDDRRVMFYSREFTAASGRSGLLIFEVSLEPFLSITADSTGLGKSGELFLGSLEDNGVSYISNLRFDSLAILNRAVKLGDSQSKAIQMAVQANTGTGITTDYRDTKVLSAWSYNEDLGWGIVAKIDYSEIEAQSRSLLINYIISGLLIITLAIIIGVIFSRLLINPVLSLKTSLELLGKGILPEKVDKQSNDEIGEMAGLLDNMVGGLRQTAAFAQEIGEGHFDADFKPMSEDDTLGNALLQMRDSIMEAEQKDKERNWIVTGVAEIGEILRRHDELEGLGDEILAFITKKIDAIQGALYIVNEEDHEEPLIEMTASYAYNKKKYLHAKFKFAEGLVGQAAIEQDTVLRTEIPEKYVTVTSGILGDQKPSCIILVPLITEEKVYGVIEFAGFHRFTPKEIRFLEEVSLIIARTIFNIKVNDRTRKLLAESQTMSNELTEQQEILRQNAEEMEATQEELKRTNTQLEDQIEEVNRTQKRMSLLLENASEVITIYEENRNVRYISPSVEKILGYTSADMIGKNDINNVHEDSVSEVEAMFQELLDNPFRQVTFQYQYKRKDGENIWVETTGTNLLMDKAIQGIILNTRDITERKRAEQEQRMRSQMQALSENSPDLITRLNVEGNFFYINPVIEHFTGLKPDHFLNRNLKDVELKPAIVQEWEKIINDIKESKSKLSREMDFPAETEDKVVQVNAIPEFGENNDLESVLVVSHDITERKAIELEIQSKNKKITESINYARRIQGAILPDNDVIQRVLQNSFILYKAKDVVSGDFPWYMQIGNKVFIAAVDCTGHGVPGALISLIGYFLLNDIVRSRKIYDPGEILDLLDDGVTRTLRQDQEGSKTKDGMDIALCKIDLDENEIVYAGAHRPLYYVMDGQLEEIKGNKFPIGGGIYKNQTNFDATHIKIEKNLAIYFCSDGFPDQFGGPEQRKFGPRRLRETIMEIHEKPMYQQQEVFDKEWEEWKGDTKQTDDMLLIGIKF